MSVSKFFPSTRYFNFIYYHPFGNTPPEDFLQSISDGVTSPDVLILGCGDIRSCFYTLWHNFDPQHSRIFRGVHFVLNDSSAAVTARNVLFLYLCTQMPSDQVAIKKWTASFWSIWFCHELLPDHHQVLINALSQLIKWSKDISTWSRSVDNPLKSLVQFATLSTLEKVNKTWIMWLGGNSTAHEMTAEKIKSFKLIPEYYTMQDPTNQLIRCFGSVLVKNVSPIQRQIMKDEITSYYKSGNTYAEDVLCLPVKKSESINNSFMERPVSKYTIPCTAIPYKCFYHTFQFSPKELRRRKLSKYPLIVEGSEFAQQPLLANSVQQFSIWVQSCARTFSSGDRCVVFTIQCCDALELCQQLRDHPELFSCSVPSLFDVVYSSNLMDFTAPPSLVLLALSVLKESGLLFATSFHSTGIFKTSHCYLKEMFGFDCKYLPVLTGARCIDVESEYSGKVCLKPMPYDLASSYTTFIWQHIPPATVVTGVKNLDNMFKILCDAIVHIVGYPLQGDGKSRMISLMCTETAIPILQSFVAQLDPNVYDHDSCQFWEPLSSLLLGQKCMKAFLTSLQMHTLLHGLHLHLTVSNETCPMCNKRPTTDFIKQCSVEVAHQGIDYNEPRYTVVIHKSSQSFNMYNIWKQITSGCVDDVHVIDCLAGYEVGEALKCDFFAPQDLLAGEYTSTVLSMNFNRQVPFSIGRTLNKQTGDKISYTFSGFLRRSNSTQSNFGKLAQHYGDVDHFESVVSLSDETLSILQEHKFSTRLSTCNTLTLVAGNLSIDICYPYPVEYGKVSVTLSRKKRTVVVVARRKTHCLYEECPAFIVNPDNALALPTTFIGPEDGCVFSGFQYSPEDRVLMNKLGRQISLMPAEINVKETMSCFFQQRECCFQLVNQMPSSKTVVGLVAVRDQLFDLANKTPAIDLYFCFTTEEMCKKIYKKWMRFCASIAPRAREIFVDNTERQLLEKLFKHFASRTMITASKPAMGGHIKGELIDNKIDHLFTRAVVYPLYPHQDVFTATSGPVSKPHYSTQQLQDENKCSYCGQSSVDLKKCSRCRSVQYCGRDCQKKHWTTHKPDCH